eukprot:m.339071 g.339071  ORF g.339071 m.339071 type:complete len:346 (+) comp20575_c0_seq3:99-1136(+)
MWWDATLKPCGRARRAIMPAAVYILFASLTADGYDSLTSSVKQYEPWDIRVSVTEKVPNPFNISLDAIYANISSPDRIISRVVPFFFQNFTRSQAVNGSEVLVPAGTPHFRLRFTPTEPGIYAVTFVGMVWETGGTNTSWCSFQCTSSTGTNQGFARVSPNRQFFETSDNSTLYLLGENIVFPGRDPILTTYNYTLKYKYAHWGTFMYDRYLSRMASSGGNYVRLWIGLSCDESAATPLSLAGGPAGSFGTCSVVSIAFPCTVEHSPGSIFRCSGHALVQHIQEPTAACTWKLDQRTKIMSILSIAFVFQPPQTPFSSLPDFHAEYSGILEYVQIVPDSYCALTI